MTYTEAALIGVAGALAVDLFVWRTRLVTRKVWWVSYAIVVFFQLLTNGVLTGLRIVQYDPAAILGNGGPRFFGDGRVVYAPVEDLLFGFALVLFSVSTWVWLGRRSRPGWRPSPWAVRIGVLVAVWVVAWTLLALFATRHQGFDLRIYHHAIRWWWHGHDLYGYQEPGSHNGFTYPPFAAVALGPLAALPFGVAHGLLLVVNLGLVALVLRWLLRPLAADRGWPLWYVVLLALPLAVALEPIRETLGFGQVNLLLGLLVATDAVRLARGKRHGVGVGIGLAAAVKLTPTVFILFLFASRRWRAGATATGTALAATLLAAALDWSTSWKFWTDSLWQTRRVGRFDSTPNQSLQGLLARLADTGNPSRLLWLGCLLVLLAIGLWRASVASRAGDQLGAWTITGLLSCAASPVGWTHHLIWVLPAVVVLVRSGLERGSPAWLVAAALTYGIFVSSIIWLWRRFAPHHWDHGLLGILYENAYILVVIVLICALPFRRGSDAELAAA